MKGNVLIDTLEARNRNTVPQQFLDRGIMRQAAVFAIVSRYPVMLVQCPWFLQTTADWAATNSLVYYGPGVAGSTIALPADCWMLKAVLVDQAAGKIATPVDLRQDAGVEANSLQKATFNYPKYRKDKNSIDLFGDDGYTGKFVYLRAPNLPTDETFEDIELTEPNDVALPVFHWFLEEEILIEADYQLRERSRGAADAPSAIAQMQSAVTAAMEELHAKSDPMALYAQDLLGRASS